MYLVILHHRTDKRDNEAPETIMIIKMISQIISQQNWERAKFLRLILAFEKLHTIARISPTMGIAKSTVYPKYPHIEIGRYCSGPLYISFIIFLL